MNDHERNYETPPLEESSLAPTHLGADADGQRLSAPKEQLQRQDSALGKEDQQVAAERPSLDEPAPVETNVSVVREGIQRYGQPFLAYLILDGVEQQSLDLIEQYEQRYIGSFPDRRSFATWAITELGWSEELVALRRLQGMWPDPVKWNLNRLWPALVERYALTERLGGVHAFRR